MKENERRCHVYANDATTKITLATVIVAIPTRATTFDSSRVVCCSYSSKSSGSTIAGMLPVTPPSARIGRKKASSRSPIVRVAPGVARALRGAVAAEPSGVRRVGALRSCVVGVAVVPHTRP